MMTHQLEVSILAAPLGAIDRRVLSQAWYSALGLASSRPDAPATSASARTTAAAAFVRGGPATAMPHRAGAPLLPVRAVPRKAAGIPLNCASRNEFHRRTVRSKLAVQIERTFADPGSHVRRATFSLGRGSVRVHVILQTKGEHAVLLAICSPEVRGIVSRALTQARHALAARGIDLELRKNEDRTCS
ncbi:MAG TPA: hypothetical protein VN909_03645 [Candidatus Dormibacteraeota bacterium]|nr:hypothetical protein [Candidatus Dormibacteraeota bacterium]